ncbi:Uncharacterised protein [Corynebacterium striatum]|uniref:hypothetical protein n=1 Tax=Corynebacterium striatum TaxID=43770 RepID=UPI0010277DA8|nr:hypothetical protein [Corynebacterium striatum]VFB07765.1 Uncharacterised protein [Corynebacterium striatum]
MHLPKITISPNAFRVDGQELIVMDDPAPTICHIGRKIYGVSVTIPSDDIDLDADARYTDETELEANDVHPGQETRIIRRLVGQPEVMEE